MVAWISAAIIAPCLALTASEPAPATESPAVSESAPATETPQAEPSEDRSEGDEMPSFYVREATGKRPDMATCLVCRHGARPVITVWARKIDPQVEELLKSVDEVVDSRRGDGLRGFAVILERRGDDEPSVESELRTLAHKRRLSMPLTTPVERGGPSSLRLPEETRTIVLIHARKKIVARFEIAEGELSSERVAEIVAEAGEQANRHAD